MALAARRLLLRSKGFNYWIAGGQSLRRSIPSSNLRPFSSSGPQLVKGRKSKSKSSEEEDADTTLAQDMGVPTPAEAKQWQQEFERRFEETGDIGSVLDLLDHDALTVEQRKTMLGMINQLEGLEKEEEHYQNLVNSIANAPDDPEALHQLLLRSGEDPRELLQRNLTDLEKEALQQDRSMDQFLDDPLRLRSLAQRSLEETYGKKSDRESEMDLPRGDKVSLKKMLEEAQSRKGGSLVDGWLNRDSEDRNASRRFERKDGLLERLLGVISDPDMEKTKPDNGFWNYGEEEDLGEDEEFRNDDMSSKGHDELEQHREIREYARYAVWELPLLSKLRQPFQVPSSDRVLRFRYTTYFGEEHPAAKKVVVEFSPEDLKLKSVQKSKLIKLAGMRYNPSTKIVKISCESFDTQAQNKRYLGDLVDILIKEAKDPADTFEDVPFDFRHHKPKPVYKFPEEWKLTPERKKLLEEKRRSRLEADQTKLLEGKILDGAKVIEEEQMKKEALMGEHVFVQAGARKQPLLR